MRKKRSAEEFPVKKKQKQNRGFKEEKLYSIAFPLLLVYIALVIAFIANTIIGVTKFSDEAEVASKSETSQNNIIGELSVASEQINLGEFRLTAYCACEKCCGKWALNRPFDENGEVIVYTASMKRAESGWTIAADTDILPFGTKIWIDGHEYEVQDRGGAIKGNRIDIYFDTHEEACQFGVQYKDVFVDNSFDIER